MSDCQACGLQHCVEAWRRLTRGNWVLQAVQGCYIPFTSTPRQTRPHLGISFSQTEMGFVRSEVATLLSQGVISEVDNTSHDEEEFLANVFQ